MMQQDGVIRVEGIIPQAAVEAVSRLPGVSQAALNAVDGARQLVVVSPDLRAVLPEVIAALLAQGAVIQHMAPTEATLEDVFIALTGRTLAVDTTQQ